MGRDDRGVPYHAESTLSSAQVLKYGFKVGVENQYGTPGSRGSEETECIDHTTPHVGSPSAVGLVCSHHHTVGGARAM